MIGMRWRVFPICTFYIFVFSFCGCTKEDVIGNVVFPSDTALDFSRYALVIEPYITFRDKPGDDGIVSSHARLGEIFEIEAIKTEMVRGGHVVWVYLKDAGWITSESVRLYSTKEKAVNASKKIK